MKITKKNRDWQQKKVHRVSNVMAQQLDEFRDKHPAHQKYKAQVLRIVIPRLGASEK